MALKKRQKDILRALELLGGRATTRKVAKKVNLPVNGVAQSLGSMDRNVRCLGGKAGETKWEVIQNNE